MTIFRKCHLNYPSIIFPNDILQYGWELAYILANIPQCLNGDGSLPQMEELHNFICFNKLFEKEYFYNKINELIALELVYKEENE